MILIVPLRIAMILIVLQYVSRARRHVEFHGNPGRSKHTFHTKIRCHCRHRFALHTARRHCHDNDLWRGHPGYCRWVWCDHLYDCRCGVLWTGAGGEHGHVWWRGAGTGLRWHDHIFLLRATTRGSDREARCRGCRLYSRCIRRRLKHKLGTRLLGNNKKDVKLQYFMLTVI